MFLACFRQASIFTRQSCAANRVPPTQRVVVTSRHSMPQRNLVTYCVTENYHIRHADLQHVYYFTLDVRTALLYALRLQLETITDSVE